uniref:Uncharacterized protein n=1 Tax=Arundo donax TaxID=35708 RepID=A0A0A9E8W7_ARUDO
MRLPCCCGRWRRAVACRTMSHTMWSLLSWPGKVSWRRRQSWLIECGCPRKHHHSLITHLSLGCLQRAMSKMLKLCSWRWRMKVLCLHW